MLSPLPAGRKGATESEVRNLWMKWLRLDVNEPVPFRRKRTDLGIGEPIELVEIKTAALLHID